MIRAYYLLYLSDLSALSAFRRSDLNQTTRLLPPKIRVTGQTLDTRTSARDSERRFRASKRKTWGAARLWRVAFNSKISVPVTVMHSHCMPSHCIVREYDPSGDPPPFSRTSKLKQKPHTRKEKQNKGPGMAHE